MISGSPFISLPAPWLRALLLIACVSLLASCRLEQSVVGEGTIVSDNVAHICQSEQCLIDIPPGGLNETYTAVAAPGYRFIGWEGLCQNEPLAPCTVKIPALPSMLAIDLHLTANFAAIDTGETPPPDPDKAGYSLLDLGSSVEQPSIIAFAIRIQERPGGQPAEGLGIDNFFITEDGQQVSESESFLDLESIGNIPTTFRLSLLLDVSRSISPLDLAEMKKAAIAIISQNSVDGQTLNEGLEIQLISFDSEVNILQSYTNEASRLLDAVDSIIPGGNATNLYGAVETALKSWTDSYKLGHIEAGAAIVITDGQDTAGVRTAANVRQYSDTRTVFAIAVGEEAQSGHLEVFADEVFDITEFSELEPALTAAVNRAKDYTDGLYILYYASPKRFGYHTLEVGLSDNAACSDTETDCLLTISKTYFAGNFEDVYPTVRVDGSLRIGIGQQTVLSARTQWADDTLSSYTWTINPPSSAVSMSVSQDSRNAEVSSVNGQAAMVDIDVFDVFWGYGTSITLEVSDTP